MKAPQILNQAADTIEQRGKDYDQGGGERSVEAAITAFNAITGHWLTEPDGWLFLQILKDVRQWARPGRHHADSALDCVAYAALKAEALARAEAKATEKYWCKRCGAGLAYEGAEWCADCQCMDASK